MNILLTTERSEVVPFFRAVRTKKKGREATPMGAKPLIRGREATPSLQGLAVRSSVFSTKVVQNVDGFGRKLVGTIFEPNWTN